MAFVTRSRLAVQLAALIISTVLAKPLGTAILPVHSSSTRTKLSSGKIPVLMYHNIACGEGNLSVCPGALYEQLLFMYERGFRAISLDEYTRRDYSRLSAGEKPYMLTFDDDAPSQFLLRAGKPNSQSAVGVLETFALDFSVRTPAVFFVNTTSAIFGEKISELEKLTYLAAHDFTIANHTASHTNLSSANTSQATSAFVRAERTLDYLLGSNRGGPKVAAFPFGALPSRAVRDSLYDALTAEGYLLLFHAYGGLSQQISEKHFDPTAVNRYETHDTGNTPGGLAWVLSRFPVASVTHR